MTEIQRDRDGFQMRGAHNTRLEAFVDAAFAFAVTLLVIGGNDVPVTLDDMRSMLKDVPAFAASFALIAQIWWSHYRHSQRYGLDDGRMAIYSLLLVFLVLVYVYPLKLLFTTFFAWISNGWLQNRPLRFESFDDVRMMFAAYGFAWAILSLLFCGMFRHALRHAAHLALDAREQLHTRFDLVHWMLNLSFGLASAVLALTLPERMPYGWMYGLPGLMYFALGPAHGLLAWQRLRRLRQLPSPAAT